MFRILIEEAPYLIDDKSFEKCEGKSTKEQFSIQIDGVRKALGIDTMEDVELLVECFYGYETILLEQEAEIDKEELDLIAEMDLGMDADEGEALKMTKHNTENRSKNVTEKGKPNSSNNVDELASPRSEESEKDPNALDLNPDNVCAALSYFEETRKQKAIEEAMNGTTKKKKNTAETEE